MANYIIIKYNVEGTRMFKVPIIHIYPTNPINIKIAFPDIDDINIKITQNIIIKQSLTEPFPNFNLFINDKIISTKRFIYNNGTIIINTHGNECTYRETFEIHYDS